MGSWTDLDAIYPPGALSPAAAFAAALGRLAGAGSAYDAHGAPAAFLPRPGIAYDQDVLARVERSLAEQDDEAFFAEACALLSRRQKLCLALNLLDRCITQGMPLEQRAFLGRAIEGLGLTPADLDPYRAALELKGDLSIFPQ